MTSLKKRLIDKSIEAYILALETINRLSVKYRVETFCFLICNAWELLLKAKIIENEGKPKTIYYKKKKGEPKRSLSLRDCLNKLIPDEKHPERRNIEQITGLRDESVHLIFSHIPREVLGLFQACVINYHNRLKDWFKISLSDRVPVGMMSIVFDINPGQIDLTDKKLKRELGSEAATYLVRYCSDLKKELDDFQGSAQFSIGIGYKLVLTKKEKDADITLSAGPSGAITQVVEVPKDPSKSHPFRQKEVIEKINLAITGSVINQHDIQCINRVYNVKQRPEYFYQGKIKGSPGQYSQSFVNWVVKQFTKDQEFFQKCRTKAKA